MMVESDSPVQACEACGSPLDVSGLEPLQRVACPVCGEPMVVSRLIGEFELVEVMGRGGMGVVYRAQDTRLDRAVALKLLRRDMAESGFLTELESEAAVTASINHPHVVKVFTTGTSNGRFYIAMELVDRGTLDELMDLQGRIAEAQGLEVAIQIAQGLRAAHQHGLIHRDIKPGNILFSDAHTSKIVDFGLAIMEEASRGTNEIWGTPYYVSPERLDQKPEDFRSDIYSLGATIFHALAGRPPFEAEDATMVAIKHLKSQAVSLQAFAPWISGQTAFVINRMLLKDPDARYQSYDELIEHLEYARNELAVSGGRPLAKKRVVLETAQDRRREGLLTTIMIGALVLICLGGGLYFFLAHQKSDQPTDPVAKSVNASGPAAQQFDAARRALIDGKSAEAAEGFHALAADAKAREPLAQWALLHEGLAWLHEGQLPKAADAFKRLGAKPYTSKEPGTGRLTTFFKDAAALGTDAAPTPAAKFQEMQGGSYSALLLLIAGWKDWQLNDFDDGAALLRQFESGAPGGEWAWIGEYRPLSSDYLSDYSDYRGSMATLKTAHSVTEIQAAVATVRKVKAELKQPNGPLGVKLETAAADAAKNADEMTKKAAAQLEAEKQALAGARGRVASLAREWKFKEARDALNPVALTNADFLREKRSLNQKIDWLQRFRDTLVKDLAAGFDKGPIKAKDGKPLEGKVTKASEAGLELTVEGAAPVPKKWVDLSPESILAMATSFNTPQVPDANTRRWTAGVYAVVAGRKDDARKLLTEAAKSVPEFADQLPLLIPPKRTNVAKGKPVTSSDPNQKSNAPDGPEKAIDGDANTAWKLSAPGQKWLQIDLGKGSSISRWVVKHASSHKEPGELDTADFSLQRSDDAQKWADVDKVRNNTIGYTDRHVTPFTARYVRLVIDKPNRKPGDQVARIFDLEIYAADPAADVVPDLFATPQSAAVPELTGSDINLTPNEGTGMTSVDDRTGVFTIRSGGSGIGGNADGLRFVHRPLDGDGQVILRLESIDRNVPASRAGIMLREGTAPDARMVFVGGSATPGVAFIRRKEPKAAAASNTDSSISAPCWLKLERAGNAFTASASTDGKTWKQIGTETIALPANAEAGAAVTAQSTNQATTAKLEFIALKRGK